MCSDSECPDSRVYNKLPRDGGVTAPLATQWVTASRFALSNVASTGRMWPFQFKLVELRKI